MACPRVTRSALLALARRVGLAICVAPLALIGGTGLALAAAGPIGISPAGDVVAKAPLAVSVTFATPLRSAGARLQVISATGADVGRGSVTTAAKTLRRQLRIGAPGGNYSITWTAVSAAGERMSGVFSFTAARGNGPTPSGLLVSAAPTATAEQFPPGPAGVADGPAVQPDSTMGEAAPAIPVASSSQPSKGRELPHGFTAVPLAVGACLVLAAGLVARLNRRRAHAA